MKIAIKEIKVGLDFGSGIQPVGRLAISNGIIYFEYDEEFLQSNLEISPIILPLQRGVIELPRDPFEGLAGVFNDSLPDGWEDCSLIVCFARKEFLHLTFHHLTV